MEFLKPLSLVICIIGLLVYLVVPLETQNGRVVRVGELMFGIGLFCYLFLNKNVN